MTAMRIEMMDQARVSKKPGQDIHNESALQSVVKDRLVILYGAGEWAESILLYLERFDCTPEALCVSNDQSLEAKFATDIRIVPITSIDKNTDTVILIALSEKWQDEVYRNLIQSGYREVYKIDPSYYHVQIERDEDVSRKRLWNSVVFNRAFETDNRRIEDYENKYREMSERYHSVVLRAGFGRTIGGLLLELFYHFHFDNRDTNEYYLYQLINTEPAVRRQYREPNTEAIRRFHGPGFEMINSETIGFWKYVFNHYPEFVDVDTAYDYDEDVMRAAIRRMHDFSFTNREADDFIYEPSDEKRGEAALRDLGVQKHFGCVFSRDSGYYRSTWTKRDSHIQAMEQYRDSDISSFSGAVDVFSKSGYQSVRVGKFPGSKEMIPGLIDYAGSSHDDFMDLYLAKRCSFYFGDHSGVLLFQAFKDVPIAITNYPLITSYDDGTFPFVRERDLIIYHKFYDPQKGRLLNLSELLEIEDCSEESYVYSGSVKVFEKYRERGIQPISNSPEEIRELAAELMERMNGEQNYTDEDEELQEAYWSILMPYVQSRPRVFWIDARVGRNFLRNNRWLTR